MNDRWTAWALAAGRVALGASALALPGLVVRTMVGQDDRHPTVTMLARLAGIRDLALGIATLDALRHGGGAARLLWVGALCDLTDGVLTVRQPALPARARLPATATAWSAAAVGVWQATRQTASRATAG